jgi:PAS domain S-box-containing protein
MSEVLRVLQVEDSESDAALIVRLLERGGYEVRAERVDDLPAMTAALAAQTWDVIIADYRLPQFDAPAALEVLHEAGLDLPFIVVSGTIGEDLAVAMMKAGAHDYLMKDNLARLAPAVKREIQDARVRRERHEAEQAAGFALAAAEEHQRLLDAVFAAQTDGVFVCDANGRVIQTNPAMTALFGFDLTGMGLDEIITKVRLATDLDSCAPCHALLGETIIGAEHVTGERIVEISSAPIRDHAGAIAGAVTICHDITNRKRHEADREAMMGLLRLLNSPSDTKELIGTATGLLRDWSGCETVAIRLRGDDFPHIETAGLPAENVDAEKYLCARAADGNPGLEDQGNPASECGCGDVLSERAEQPRFWTNSVSRLLAEDREAEQWSGMRTCCLIEGFESVALVPLRSSRRTFGLLQFADKRPDRFTPDSISQLERGAASLAIALEQRRAQDELRASEERYRLISENTTDVISLMDVDSGRYIYVSPSAQHVFGYSPDEIMAKTPGATLTPESFELANRRMTEVVTAFRAGKSAPTAVHQLDHIRKDGTVIRTEVLTTFLPSRDGRGGALLVVARDITARAHVEARLMEAQKLQSVGRLAGGVAHDFNNLLTVINGYSNLVLQDLSPDDPVRESIVEIAVAGERAAALTAQLLMLSRRQVVRPKVVNWNDIILEVEKMLGRLIGEDIRLRSALSPELGRVLADPGHLHQVLMNLAVNARAAMPNGGTLLIETTNVFLEEGAAEQHPDMAPGPYVQLDVSDTGTGMTKEVLEHVFEPFFTTKKAGEGTGLGLATVYGIVKQCGGSISVHSEPGMGTRFRISLPRIEAPDAQREDPQPLSSVVRGTETVLVVEDQEQLRKMVTRVLRGHGYQVYEAANPAEAIHYAEGNDSPIDLLLTDVVMPGMSGCELAERLKLPRPTMAIMFMSGYSERALLDRVEGAYLAKPFSPETLAVKVREVLGGMRPTST